MKPGLRYLAVAAAIAVIGAILAWYARAHPVVVTFFGIWLVLLPVVVFVYIGVLELCFGRRVASGSGGGGDQDPFARLVLEPARSGGSARSEEPLVQPDKAAA